MADSTPMPTSASAQTTPMVTIEALDARIISLEVELVALRQQRNELFAPMSYLPAELKINILKHALHEDYHPSRHGSDVIDSFFPQFHLTIGRGCMHLGALCRSWRTTALETSELWQQVDTRKSIEWQNLCVERARGLLPVIYTYYNTQSLSPGQSRAVLKSTSAQLPQAIEAYMSFEAGKASVGLLRNVKCPNLRHLYLDAPQLMFNNLVMGGTLLSPTTLNLRIHSLDETMPMCPNLRHLKIEMMIPTMELLMEGLKELDRLEVLFLVLGRHDCYVPPQQATNGMQLPMLRLLRLKGNMYTCCNVLKALLVPGPSIGLRVDAIVHYDIFGNSKRHHEEHTVAYRELMTPINQYRKEQSLAPMHARITISGVNAKAHLSTYPASRQENPMDLSYPFCELHGPYLPDELESLSSVEVLHFVGDQRWRLASLIEGNDTTGELLDKHHIEEMDCIETVIVENPKTVAYLELLFKWLVKRKVEARPIRVLKMLMTAPSDVAKNTVETLTAPLLEQKVINEVKWCL